MEETADAGGVRALAEVWRVVVSRVREDVATFLDDWLPILKMDFHADWVPGLVGDSG